MIDMNMLVAGNIKKLRENAKFSLEELARRSGVSKSMLAQIERGEGNPTLSTLSKVAIGLKVPFDALTVRSKREFEIVRFYDIAPIEDNKGKVRNYSIFPDDENRRFGLYYVEVEPGGHWASEPHLPGTTEFLSILSGQLTVQWGHEEHTVHNGEHVRFHADIPHSYRNSGQLLTGMYMIIYTPVVVYAT